MTKRALISVWNKDKLVEFATELVEKYDVSRFHKDVLVANGLKGNIQGPRRINELENLLNFNNDVWVKEIDNIFTDNSFIGKEKEVSQITIC